MISVASVNVNGIRAARRRGMGQWWDRCGATVLCLQEVRATDAQLAAEVDAMGRSDWDVAHAESDRAGRAGVAVISGVPVLAARGGGPSEEFDAQGRWVEADLDVSVGGRPLTVVSVYVHTGEAGTARQDEKMRFLAAAQVRMSELREQGRAVLVCGDLNVAHREDDLKNWRGNRGRSGFLPQERAVLDTWLDDLGWTDVQRAHAGPGPGPYAWWSWRGKAFDNDAGWRIDYQFASPEVAAAALRVRTDRADTYALRWSDHAPVVASYDADPGEPGDSSRSSRQSMAGAP